MRSASTFTEAAAGSSAMKPALIKTTLNRLLRSWATAAVTSWSRSSAAGSRSVGRTLLRGSAGGVGEHQGFGALGAVAQPAFDDRPGLPAPVPPWIGGSRRPLDVGLTGLP